ncbi:long-chain fatty acid--CoA ligase [Rhodococcus sp. WS4]|nr:long-chain fatty acid--CoA ligase [Rhodococcus sp. WS4]
MYNLADLVDVSADLGSTRAAFVGPNEQVTYRELADQISAARAGLRELGVGRGDRVAVSLRYAPDFAVAFYAILGIGAVAVPMNPALTPREASHYLGDSGAQVLVGLDQVDRRWIEGTDVVLVDIDRLRRHEDRSPKTAVAIDDTAVILYTSGTTGVPKGAELTHANMYFNATVLADPAYFGLAQTDVVAGLLPLFHTMGILVLNLTMKAGAAMWPIEKFEARRVAELIAAGRVSAMVGVPTHLQMLMTHSDGLDFPTPLRRLTTAGAGLPPKVQAWAESRLGTPVLEGYGLTEASPTVAHNRADGPIPPGSVGRPLPGVEVKIVDALGTEAATNWLGEIVVRGPNVMKGYWNNPAATAAAISDGWLATGDIGRVDADGYLYIVDRLKQVIIRGGFNVYPGEVEAVLREHPDVAEAAVVGIPDERVGEEIAAFVVSTGAPLTEENLREFARTRLASYKSPRRFVLTTDLPRTATGKIARTQLPALLADR